MSILDTARPGNVLFQIGAYDLPTANEAIERINQDLLPHQSKFCDDLDHRKLALVCGFGAGKTHALISNLAYWQHSMLVMCRQSLNRLRQCLETFCKEQ